MTRIAIFASGTGTNAREIIRHLKNNSRTKVSLIVASNSNAGVLNIANKNNIPSLILKRESYFNSENLLDHLKNIDLIVLAGFLWFIPDYLTKSFSKRIINIHPSLLPKYGGKGMYGINVHKAVIANKESESGITIHHVNERFDEGEIIFQTKCEVFPNDSVDSLAKRIHKLEHAHFPMVVEKLAINLTR